MPTADKQDKVKQTGSPADMLRLEVQTLLEQEKRRINDEIAHYPPPIPACDAQFNYLLEQRGQISQELYQLRQASAASVSQAETMNRLETFIKASAFIDEAQKQRLLADLETH